jgi:dTMP kinase
VHDLQSLTALRYRLKVIVTGPRRASRDDRPATPGPDRSLDEESKVTCGLLIALEGIDGSGTTTQAMRLGQHFGSRAHVTREPSTGPVGQLLRRILGGEHAPVDPAVVALLFAADRRDHLAREVEPALAQGRLVITDRYLLSSLAYQTITAERAWVAQLNAHARPADLTVLLDLPVEVAAARRQARGGQEELFDARELQERVAIAYRGEAALLAAGGARVVTLDGAGPPDAVERAIRAAVETCLVGATSAS